MRELSAKNLASSVKVERPSCVEQHNLRHLKKKSPQLISINSLECATIILSCNAVLDSLELLHANTPSHPKVQMMCDNTSIDAKTRKISSSSATGKQLNRLFCSLLTNQSLGLDSTFLPGRDNNVAGKMSCLKAPLISINSLLQTYPFLGSCHR